MPETYNDDLRREVEQEESWSSSDSDLHLESSNDTEIITVPVEHVPRVQEVDRTFLRERLLLAVYRLDMENMLRWVEAVQAAQQDGGAHDGSNTDTALDTDTAPDTDTASVQYADDTVDTQAPDTQDTQAIP